MKQYLGIKAEYPNAILFFRLGDFYEMFFEDAVLAAGALDLTLTARHKNTPDPIPMAGLPHHAARGYIARLIKQGHSVALCEQVEDPKKTKKIVKRAVVRVITPGIALDEDILDAKAGSYVASICKVGPDLGFSFLDVSTGEFRTMQTNSAARMLAEVTKIGPAEILVDDPSLECLSELAARLPGSLFRKSWNGLNFDESVKILEEEIPSSVQKKKKAATVAAATALQYVRETQKGGTLPFVRVLYYEPNDFLTLDDTAVRNLELLSTMVRGEKKGSLLHTIDKTQTSMGGRLLRAWMLFPSLCLKEIGKRHDSVGFFVSANGARDDVRIALKSISDVERILARILLDVAGPLDLGRLRDSLNAVPEVLSGIQKGGLVSLPEKVTLSASVLKTTAKVAKELALALSDSPPRTVRDGGFIREGFCEVVDELAALAKGGKDEVSRIEERERQATGIPNLKVKYNRVFGYFLEVSKSYLDKVPKSYARKQTIANGERYVISELAELESKILSAQEKLQTREAELYGRLCQVVAAAHEQLLIVSQWLAEVDALAGLAEFAHKNQCHRPQLDSELELKITGGRHAVISAQLADGKMFVPNDCTFSDSRKLLLITGPNMAGKSTYMRQVAHIVILAQMGAYVPATEARVGLVDRIFTRVGAVDDVTTGDSTFMVEMRETATIVSEATSRSLVILDEVGRGTSTYDGVSIAWAVSEYLHDAVSARTMFATHYHELAQLQNQCPNVANISVAVKEHQGNIVFLHQVREGAANQSFGIDVAKLAGLPNSLISRARAILSQLESGKKLSESTQMALFSAADMPSRSAVEDAIAQTDLNNLTPLQAMQLIADWKTQIT